MVEQTNPQVKKLVTQFKHYLGKLWSNNNTLKYMTMSKDLITTLMTQCLFLKKM